MKATPGLVQLLAETLASGTGLQPSNVAPGMTLNNSRCFDSPPPVSPRSHFGQIPAPECGHCAELLHTLSVAARMGF